MAYHISYTKKAGKSFLELSKKDQVSIQKRIDILSENPHSKLLDITKLKNEEMTYRIRIGTFRVIYKIDHGKIIIFILKVGHRRYIYR